MPEWLTFLHLSDIHFRRWSGDKYDIEGDLRNELLRDAQNVRQELGDVSAVLISGDIAYSGIADEYEQAKGFLRDLCKRVGVLEDRVWCVPGNHDVDRSCIKGSHLLKSLHSQVKQRKPDQVDAEMSACMRDPESGEVLLRPLSEYNRFAAAFRCEIRRDEPVWHADFQLNDGSTLRLNGLNSAMMSDEDDNKLRKVVLGRFQIPGSEEGMTHVVLCHQRISPLCGT